MSKRRIAPAAAAALIVLGITLPALSSRDAHAISIAIGGGGTYSFPVVSGYTTAFDFKPKFGAPGIALELGIPMGQSVELGLGGAYLTRTWSDGATGDLKATSAAPTLMLRARLANWLWLGAGFTYATAIGDLKRSGNSVSYDDYGLKKTDFGPTAALRIQVSVLFLEARHTYGVANMATQSGQTFKLADSSALIGLRFGGGSKNH